MRFRCFDAWNCQKDHKLCQRWKKQLLLQISISQSMKFFRNSQRSFIKRKLVYVICHQTVSMRVFFILRYLCQSGSRFCRFDQIFLIIIQANLIKTLMQLIPLNQNIFFNATAISASDLANIVIIAMAYHPLYVNLLYLLYGIDNTRTSSYSSFHLLLRDSNTGLFIQNATLTDIYGCQVGCEIKATQYLFLIESQLGSWIYSIDTSSQAVNFPRIYRLFKPANSYLADIFRHADIFYDKYVVFNLTSPPAYEIIFGRLSGSKYVYTFSMKGSQVMHTGLYQKQVYAVLQQDPIVAYIYNCVQCIYNGSITNATNITGISLYINLSVSVTQSFRLYQGYQINNNLLSGGKIYWGFNAGGTSKKMIINGTSSMTLQTILTSESNSAANHQKLLYFGTTTQLFENSFDTANFTASTSYIYEAIIQKLSLSNPTTRTMLALHIKNDYPWKINQYQVVSNCSNYNATDSNGSLVCSCSQYNSNNLCVSLLDQSSSTESFPIAAIIAVIAGIGIFFLYLVFVSVSIILIKKNYKRCTKGRSRTPYKYSPIQLMSFES